MESITDQMEEELYDRIRKPLEILGTAVVGTKYNKTLQIWEEQGRFTGISRYLRGESRQDILMILKTIAELLPQVNDKDMMERLKPKIQKAIIGMDNICMTYSDSSAHVDTIKVYITLFKEYL